MSDKRIARWPQRKSRRVRDLVAAMPAVGNCSQCGGDLRPWWSLYSGTHSKQKCYECYLANHRERSHRQKSSAKPYTPKPSGMIVECVVCGTVFQRSSRASGCSPECRDEIRKAKVRRHNARRRGGATGNLYTLRLVYDKAGGICQLCHLPVDLTISSAEPEGATVDHVVPLSLGGIDCESNVQLAHRRCNSIRGAKPLEVSA